MATKKVAKKAAKKAPAKKAAKKAVKKAPAKKVAKKAAVKKVAKKAPAKKAAVKKVAKKAPTKRVSTAPAVAVSSAPTTSAPVAPKAPAAAPAKKQGGQNRVMLAVIIGVLALGAIVISNGSDSDDAAPMPTESASASATPTESESSATVSTTAAPLGIVAKYTAEGATIFWDATTAAEGLKGYSIEVSSNGGEFTEIVMLGVDATQHNITKSDTEGWMSFKVSAVYNDGQKAEGKVFGLPGQYTN
ncbi:MAG: hypothetical protein RL193_282 [Actinomycetota bacterium]